MEFEPKVSGIQYFNEDCMVGMARYPDKYFDLAIVDPPYGIGANKEKEHNGWRSLGDETVCD